MRYEQRDLGKRLRGWLYLRCKAEDLDEVLKLDLDEEQLYGLAAGTVLIDTQTAEECGKFTEELYELGVDSRRLMEALEVADRVLSAPDEEGEG